MKVNASMQSEIEQNHQFMHPGMNLVLLNGRMVDAMDTTPFGLLDTLKFEVSAMEKLTKVGLDTGSARKLLMGEVKTQAMGMHQQEEPFRIDIFDKEHVMWFNDIESDKRYAKWPRSFDALLTRGWPGQMKNVRKNFYHAIYVLDPASKDSIAALGIIANSIQGELPVKFGVLFHSAPAAKAEEAGRDAGGEVKDVKAVDEGEQLVLLITALLTRHGRDAVTDFAVSYAQKAQNLATPEEREEARKETFTKTTKAHKATGKDADGKVTRAKYAKVLNITGGSSKLVASTKFVEQTGLLPTQQPRLVINGQLIDGWGEHEMVHAVSIMQQMMQRMAYFGEIEQSTDIYKKMVTDSKNVAKRFQKQIVAGKDTSTTFLPHEALSLTQGLGWIGCGTKRIDEFRSISHLVAADMSSEAGQSVVMEAAAYLEKGGCVALVPSPSPRPAPTQRCCRPRLKMEQTCVGLC